MVEKIIYSINFIKGLEGSDKLILSAIIIAILSFVLIAIVGAFLWSKIIDIKHTHFAKSMEFAEDKLYTVYNQSFLLFKTDVNNNLTKLENESCKVCVYPKDSVEYQLNSAKVLFEKVLVERGRLRIRSRLKQNHLIKFSPKNLKEEADLFGERFYNKSMYDLQLMGISKLPIIKEVSERKNIYKIEDARAMSLKVFENYIENIKQERKEIKELIFFPLKILKVIKGML